MRGRTRDYRCPNPSHFEGARPGANGRADALFWTGARYAMDSGWNFTGAFYHASQNSWSIGLKPTGTQNVGCSGAGLLGG